MAEDHTSDATALGKLRTLAHRVHGTAGSYGFAAVSEVAGRLETLAQAAVAGAPDRAALEAIAAELRALPLD
jgi:HPt (histidine-containing phosphotransfer) domain-containing protein